MNQAAPIRADERSGVLEPANLTRFDAGWIDPDPGVGGILDRYWHVRWRLRPNEVIDQRIIDFPAITVSIEQGAVPAPFVVTGLHSRAWNRRITGSGSVFALRLRPAGLAVLSDLTPQQLADRTVPLTRALDPRLYECVADIAGVGSPADRARRCNQAVRARLQERPLTPELELANQVLDELSARIRSRTGDLADQQFGVGERTIQRALRATVGRGPKWISRRLRLQEVVRALSNGGDVDLAGLAAGLGYADQAHLTSDFRGVAGLTPGSYLRRLRAFTADRDSPDPAR